MVWESLLFLVLPTTILYHTVTSDQDGETTRRHEYDLQPPHIGHSVSLGGKLTLEQRPGRGLTEVLDIGHFESLDVTVTSNQHPDHELTKSLDSGRLGSPGGTPITEQHHNHELNKSLDSGHLGLLDGTPIPEQHHHHDVTKYLDSDQFGSLDDILIPDQHSYHELTTVLDSGHFKSLDGILTPEKYTDKGSTKSLRPSPEQILDEQSNTPQVKGLHFEDESNTPQVKGLHFEDESNTPQVKGLHFEDESNSPQVKGLHFEDESNTPQVKGLHFEDESNSPQVKGLHFEDESNSPQVKGLPTQAADHCNVLIDGNQVSCFKPEDGHYDKKLEQLQYHYPALPRVSTGTSRCSTLKYYTRRRITLGSLFSPCVETGFILRTPFFMYNIDQQLRYIVQDPPHIQQCYFDARCRFANRICFRFNIYLLMSKCHLRTCVHTLLAWNPSTPQLGTFFDTFHFACYCECPGHFHKG
ncbi:uncharacterized protein LOC143233768 [Tachypleus tridentatus]|uniref:uncharacterized protein LOC143233768 n=1 Tax=Tachypleus tridentatus TaxID=6853 RepID=UPI003FCEF0E3